MVFRLAQKAKSLLQVGDFLFSDGFGKFFVFIHFGSGFHIVKLSKLALLFQFAFSPLSKFCLSVAYYYLAFLLVKSLWQRFWQVNITKRKGINTLDFSGFGMLLVSCCIMVFIPPAMALGAFTIISKIEGKEENLNDKKISPLFIILYVLSLIVTCFLVYFFYLRFMYVM